MPSEIKPSNALPQASPPSRTVTVEANNVLRLLHALPQQLAVGQQVQAQVISAKETGQIFEILLKMAIPDGKPVTVPAQTPQIVTPGQQLTLTALSQSQLSMMPIALEKAALTLTRLDPASFPGGTVIQARVIQVDPLPQGNFRAILTLNNTTLAGQNISLETPRALPVNSILTARVDSSFQLSFIPASQQNMDRLTIQQELSGQFNRQGSVSQLFQQLMHISRSDSNSGLSGEGQKIVQQLLNNLPDISQKFNASQIAELVRHSGTLLESRMLSDVPGAIEQDLKANLLRLIGQLVPQQVGSNPLLSSAQAAIISQALPQLLREIGGFNLSQVREQAMRFPVVSRILDKLDNPNDLGALLRVAAAAISRLQTHQLASLGQTYTTAEGTQVTTWQTEIPMRNQDSVIPLQVKFQQEQHQQNQEQENKPPVWRLELSFELEPLGPLHVQVNLQEEQLSSRLWAEREQTVNLANQELHILRDKLLAAGLNIKMLDCQKGMPPTPKQAAIEQRWIDDLA